MKIKQCKCGNRKLTVVRDSHGFDGDIYHVKCDQCGRDGKQAYNSISEFAVNDAIKAWNRELVVDKVFRCFIKG